MILGLQEKKANSQFIERFLIRCREIKTKVITTANQDKENYDGSQLELELPGAREKWVTKSRFIWVLYLIGWNFGAHFIKQS